MALDCMDRWVSNERKSRCHLSFFFFCPKFCVTCVDSFRHHKLGKLISNAFLRSRVGEGRNLVKIIILRGASQNSLSKRRTEVHMNLLALVWAVN